MTDGAIDADWGENERDYAEQVADALEDVRTEPMAGAPAIDIVTRQTVFVRDVVADSLAEYYEREGFDLYTYKMHPWLPGISVDNSVYECVYLDANPQNAHKVGKTYDFPEARIMHYPAEMAWNDSEVGDV